VKTCALCVDLLFVSGSKRLGFHSFVIGCYVKILEVLLNKQPFCDIHKNTVMPSVAIKSNADAETFL
jgi:hypothetical protein